VSIITSTKKWDELLPESSVQELLQSIDSSLQENHRMVSVKRLSPGPVLLYGPSKENKIAAAALIGEHLKQDVYRIDLLAIVSKYIGETEKKLEKVFSQAADKNWILFFDEADALFGKRAEVKDSHDRYANTEVGYLLQRIEQYSNLVLLAANSKEQLPPAVQKYFHITMRCPKNK
jgi:SpoVK/Ycf46/Vps4 family AAA+-type ATPase